ncbi:MAG: PorV/PorQ family protein [candidate division WOR-3 bacterium]
MKKLLLIIISISLLANFAYSFNEGTTGAQFLKILVGSKATAMGGAFVSVADDPSALYYNPAGIATMNKMGLLLNYVKYPAEISYSYVAFAAPMGIMGALGLQAGIMTMPQMEITTVDKPEGTGEYFSASSYVVGASYAKSFTDKLTSGVTLKYIQEKIVDATSTMIAFDAGALYKTGFKSLRIGMSIRNFGSEGMFTGGTILTDKYSKWTDGQTPLNIYYKTDTYTLPMNFNFGLAYDIFEGPTNFLTTTLEFQNPNDGTENIRFGMEYNLSKILFVRLGYIFNWEKFKYVLDNMDDLTQNEKIENLTAGIGFKYGFSGIDLGIDYSYTEMGLLSDNYINGHRVTLTLNF